MKIESIPSKFAVIADLITDTINDLLEHESWDHTKIFSDLANAVVVARMLNKDLSFQSAKETSVNIELEQRGKAGMYVDDIITITLDKADNLERIIKAPNKVMHAVDDKAHSQVSQLKGKIL